MTNNSYNYRIYLRPLDYFFFGGEETFGNGEKQNYFAKTRSFPQQTTLLGVLRHLGHKNHLGHDKVDIGESFKADCLAAEHPFGYIEQLSPLFLAFQLGEEASFYLPGTFGTDQGKPFDVSAAGEAIKKWNGKQWESTLQLKGYNAKAGWNQMLISDRPLKEQPASKEIEEVVKTFDKIGITKSIDGEERKDGFYKQRMARLEKNWQFALLAKLDEKQAALLPKSSVLPFGAEKALFHIRVEKLEDELSFESLFPHRLWTHHFPDDVSAVLLLSDALASEDIYDHCKLAISDTVDFRSIYTPSGVTEFARFYQYGENSKTGKPDRLCKSGKYNLLRRGSLLYGDVEKIKAALVHPYYHSIGYNHYTILSPIK